MNCICSPLQFPQWACTLDSIINSFFSLLVNLINFQLDCICMFIEFGRSLLPLISHTYYLKERKILSVSFLGLFVWNMGHHPAGNFLQGEVNADIFKQASELLGNILNILLDGQLHPEASYQRKDWLSNYKCSKIVLLSLSKPLDCREQNGLFEHILSHLCFNNVL